MEENQLGVAEKFNSLQDTLQQQSKHLFLLQQHIDDIENRNRRNNLRVRGLPESIQSSDLHNALTTFFNNILGRPPTAHIELNRADRALRPASGDKNRPRDVICRVHFFWSQRGDSSESQTNSRPLLSWVTS